MIEAGATPAAQASGNPGGLFHGTLHGDDGPHARFNRAAALATERELRRIAPALPWLQWGLLRVEREPAALDAMRALLARCGLPADYVQALDADAASTLAGVALAQPAWFFPGGGAVSPPALVDAWLAEAARTEGFELRLGTPVARLERDDESGRWSAYGGAGQLIASADAVVLCGGIGSDPIAAKWSAGPAWPWVSQRGQLSVMAPEGAVDASASTPMSTTMATATARATATPPPNSNSNSNSNSNTMAMATPRLSMPVAGLGYALSLPDGTLCFGASADAGDVDPVLRASDQAQNLGRLKQLLPACPLPDELPLAGRVGWRSLVPDRLPVVGALPAAMPAQRAEQARFWPRQPGLMVLGALASRGLTWATLCAELVAAQLTGAPWPIEASLAEALDPARFGAKRQRAGSSSV
ncbi:FAD-dependent oxidoreductase [Mitsuaria sp. GD03876]|uniref:FAD-dependent oxidoreductase n=1 Tax=Mitsuaria sp. GD03876 TaxID=2975399 RepID=UPI00244A5B3F|nr:FAD-dependent oxidoreductase [Mitsuaria sp. GD03876]MDH0868196.1 FAD-dependent oxidoreductase [Mitsuaria sp. GD03876]